MGAKCGAMTRNSHAPSAPVVRNFAAGVTLFAAMLPLPALAQAAASASGEAIVLRPLSFFKVQDLEFGDIIASNTAGSVRIDAVGNRTATGGVTLAGGGHQVARFAGLGSFNRQVNIAMSATPIWITGPGAPMRVRNFEIGSTPTVILGTAPLRFRIVTPTGAFNFPLGATLDVGANQAGGEYSGNFTVILNYL